MATESISLREARDSLGKRVDAAHYRGDITVITKNGERRAAIVPIAFLDERAATIETPEGES